MSPARFCLGGYIFRDEVQAYSKVMVERVGALGCAPKNSSRIGSDPYDHRHRRSFAAPLSLVFLTNPLTMPADEYQYERIPTSDEKRKFPRQEPTSDVRELHRRLAQDPRFNPPTPSPWKRIALIVFLFSLLYLGLKLRLNAIQKLEAEPSVVHANRYVPLLLERDDAG